MFTKIARLLTMCLFVVTTACSPIQPPIESAESAVEVVKVTYSVTTYYKVTVIMNDKQMYFNAYGKPLCEVRNQALECKSLGGPQINALGEYKSDIPLLSTNATVFYEENLFTVTVSENTFNTFQEAIREYENQVELWEFRH